MSSSRRRALTMALIGCMVAVLVESNHHEPVPLAMVDDDEQLPAHEPLAFTCATWSEVNMSAAILGHGHYREAHEAIFRDERLVLKVPFSQWAEAPERQAHIFHSEVVRLLRMNGHPSVPRLVGYCLDPRAGRGLALLCERLLPWSRVVADDSLSWSSRLNIAISAARMLQYWQAYVDHRGITSPRFFWDLKANNVGTDVARTHIKILDVESFAPYIVVAEHHDVVPHCTEHAHCVPRRLRQYHDPVLQNLTELQCNLAAHRCDGVLDDRTNVFRVCLVIVQPLLLHAHVPEQLRDEVSSILARCMDWHHEKRLSSTDLRLQLEALRVSLHHSPHHRHDHY
jgi:hypothetical protein